MPASGKPLNPFTLSAYAGPELFCDREKETRQMTGWMENGVNVTLFAIRRLGKTGLIRHVFHPFRNSRSIACIYTDILATDNLSEFTNQIATAIYNRFPPQKSIGKKITEILRQFRPIITIDELTGKPSLELTLATKSQRETTIAQIFRFLDEQGIRVVFAIDEFQQILEYPEKNTEALLRTCMQHLRNTSFIFCGSNQKLMHEIFNTAKRPFFASCMNLSLDRIDPQVYLDFISQKFSEHKRSIDAEALEFIADWTGLHTFYTQYLCHTLFARNSRRVTLDDAREAATEILKVNETTYFQYRSLLTALQWDLLCAIGNEESVRHPQSRHFISRHNLGTPAVVKRSLDALLKKELVVQQVTAEGSYYTIYDRYFMRWIQQNQGPPLFRHT